MAVTYAGQLGSSNNRVFNHVYTGPASNVMVSGYFDQWAYFLDPGDVINVTAIDSGTSTNLRFYITDITNNVISYISETSTTSLLAMIEAQAERITLLEQNTGAPTSQFAGVLGFAALTGSVDEDGQYSFLIQRTQGSTGLITFDLNFVNSYTGTSTITCDGVACDGDTTITMADGVISATVLVVNTDVTLAGSIAFSIDTPTGGSVVDSARDTYTLTVNAAPVAGTNTIIVQDSFTTDADFTQWDGYVLTYGTTTLQITGGKAVFNTAIGSLNNVRLEENFGTYVGAAAINELWGRCIYNFVGGDGMWSTSSTNKIIQTNWEVVGGDREHQVQLLVWYNSAQARFEYLIEQIHFGLNGSPAVADGARYQTYQTGVQPVYGQDLYFRWHIINSTSGAANGTIQFWINDVQIVNWVNVATNDSDNTSPNRIIFSAYSGTAQTATGIRYLDNVLVQTDPITTYAPAAPSGSLFRLSPTSASPWSAGSNIDDEGNVTTSVLDATLNRYVLKHALGPDTSGAYGSSYAGFRVLPDNPAGLGAAIQAASSVYLMMLVKIGDAADAAANNFWERDSLAGSELKWPNISGGGFSRTILKFRPGVVDSQDTRVIFFDSDLSGNYYFNAGNTNTVDIINTNQWTWVAFRLTKTGAASTDTQLELWHGVYDGSGTEFVEGTPDGTHAGMKWIPSDWNNLAEGDWEFMFRGVEFMNGGTPVTRNVYIADCCISTGFVAPVLP